MKEFITILTIAIALSMDAFSVSLGIGTLKDEKEKNIIIASIVGIMHFIMPLLGIFLGEKILSLFHIKGHFLMSGILILLALDILFGYFKEKKQKINITLIEIILFSFSVSFDSFTTGIGLSYITQNILFASMIFAITSFCFTYLGLLIGKYSRERLGKIACLFGAILLIITGILSFFM